MPFQLYFSYIAVASSPIQTFLKFFNQLLCTIFFPSHWLFSHITIVETTDSGERGRNPVAMTIINPRKEYWPSRGSNQRPHVHKSATLPTELWGLASRSDKKAKCISVIHDIKKNIHLSLIDKFHFAI